MKEFVNMSRPQLSSATADRPEKVRLPSGYQVHAYPIPLCDAASAPILEDFMRVSVYPPGSDCIDTEDRVAELLVHRDEVDVLLSMCARPIDENGER
jgi:hypothetical protein